MSFGLFSTLVLSAISLGHLYLYRRLFRDTGLPRWGRWGGVVLLVLLGPGFIAVRQWVTLPFPWRGIVTAAQWLWIVTALYLMGLLVAADLGGWLRRRRAGRAEVSPERRQFLSRATAGTAALATGSLVGFGYWRAYGAVPEVREVAIRVPGLPPSLSGFSILQLTDVHVGSIIQRRFVDEVVARTNAARPDLVVVTGDLVDASPSQIGEAVGRLAGLRSREGTYFVTGNHEYHSDEQVWCAALEGMGLKVLRNRSVTIGQGKDSFDLLGVDDWGGRRRGRQGYDLDAALAQSRPDVARVLLAHQPANFVEAAARGIGLQISGHTHGGQVFPMTELIQLHWEHSAGLYSHHDAQLFVSRGTGFWGPPLRLGSPPEIVKLVLTA